GLPDISGLDVISRLREWYARPILVLSARNRESDKVGALDLGADVHLTPIEYRLLAALARHRGKVMTHRQLLAEVWGAAHVESPHYLRIYMRALRHKIETDPTQPKHLLTEVGVGYRLADD
ncbi:MAG: winged helix-turn-helix domain-containing protein, partial [Rudaea sp.]|nr:winged helix-turn-helix domain-containing protein [Rudaea sp.]